MIIGRNFRSTPRNNVRLANQLAAQQAYDPVVREHAINLTRSLDDVPAEGPLVVARWIRQNITYTQEPPEGELLQGYHTTMRFRAGDCDDLAMLWTSLCRSVGLPAFFVGVSAEAKPRSFFHAMGLTSYPLKSYEVTDDSRYGGVSLPIDGISIFAKSLLYWDVGRKRYVRIPVS